MKEDAAVQTEDKGTWADTFLLLGLIVICCVSGAVLGLYWRLWVLDYFFSTNDVLSGKMLFVLYIPCGVIALIIGFTWFFCFHKLFRALGIKVMDIPEPEKTESQ